VQGIVLHQRFGFGRHAAALQVVGRGVEADGKIGQRPGGERSVVGQVAHAHGHVEVLADQVDAPRRQIHLQRAPPGSRTMKSAIHGPSRLVAKSAGIDTRRRPLGSTCRCWASEDAAIHLGQHVAGVFEHAVAEVGHCELARGAQQQALAQLRLESGAGGATRSTWEYPARSAARLKLPSSTTRAKSMRSLGSIWFMAIHRSLGGTMLSILTTSGLISG
jgi:hypothetical protein